MSENRIGPQIHEAWRRPDAKYSIPRLPITEEFYWVGGRGGNLIQMSRAELRGYIQQCDRGLGSLNDIYIDQHHETMIDQATLHEIIAEARQMR